MANVEKSGGTKQKEKKGKIKMTPGTSTNKLDKQEGELPRYDSVIKILMEQQTPRSRKSKGQTKQSLNSSQPQLPQARTATVCKKKVSIKKPKGTKNQVACSQFQAEENVAANGRVEGVGTEGFREEEGRMEQLM